MFRTVDLPLWLLILLVLFAAVTFLSHFLFPSVRWFLRRRMEVGVARLNQRLKRPIEPFKLARRFDTVQRLTYDRSVLDAVSDHAAETGVPEDVALQTARRYAREIVPSFAATMYFGIAARVARRLAEWLYDVRVDSQSDEILDALDPDATVVFVMNHRSNMDYVLITYLVAEKSALSYAVGEWARFWPLSALIRSMGAYFIRRRSRDALYRRVLARYVQIATANGVTQAMFPEGGLSLDGRIGQPKLGLISYIHAAAGATQGRDVVFVPVALAYDRVLEDRVLAAAHASGTRRFRGRIVPGIAFSVRYLWRRLTGRVGRFGVAGVRFGQPLSLHHHVARGDPSVKALGRVLMERLRDAAPILPVPLVAWLCLRAGGAIPREDLADRARHLLHVTEARLMRDDPAASVERAIDALTARRILVQGPQGLTVCDRYRPLAEYYANSVDARLREFADGCDIKLQK